MQDKDYLRVIFELKEDGSYEIFEHRAFTTGFNYSADGLQQNMDDSLCDVWQYDEEDIMRVIISGLTTTGFHEAIAEIEVKVYESGWEIIEYDPKTIVVSHKVQRIFEGDQEVFREMYKEEGFYQRGMSDDS